MNPSYPPWSAPADSFQSSSCRRVRSRPEDLACAGWPAAVGQRIAAHARAVSLAGNRLVVEVEDAVWQRQLCVLKKQILKRLEEVLGQSVVRGDRVPACVPAAGMPQMRRGAPPAERRGGPDPGPVLRSIYKSSAGGDRREDHRTGSPLRGRPGQPEADRRGSRAGCAPTWTRSWRTWTS